MKKILQNHKGFSLIELIVVIAILGVLVGVAAPSYIGNVKRAKARVCASNIDTITRAYRYQRAENPSTTLQAVVQGTTPVDVSGMKCPEGGTYSVADGKIVCSIHGEAQPSPTPGESATPTPSSGPQSGYTVGDLAFISPNGVSVYVSGDWAALKEEAASNYGKSLTDGTVLRDETGTYVVRWSPYLSESDGANDIPLSQMSGVVKLDENASVLTGDDLKAAGDWTGNWETSPSVGSLYTHNGETYMCVSSSGTWTSTNVDSGVWIKLTGQDVD
ncbi:MAG: Type II secretion system protein G precursor [Firmicutes bacterium ADurb.Bin193]|nr:MAG: Type II secretion system protein G precursor [Firmicutes bacterium ADurb.Bin193]